MTVFDSRCKAGTIHADTTYLPYFATAAFGAKSRSQDDAMGADRRDRHWPARCRGGCRGHACWRPGRRRAALGGRPRTDAVDEGGGRQRQLARRQVGRVRGVRRCNDQVRRQRRVDGQRGGGLPARRRAPAQECRATAALQLGGVEARRGPMHPRQPHARRQRAVRALPPLLAHPNAPRLHRRAHRRERALVHSPNP